MKFGIIGLGTAGLAAAKALSKMGADVLVSEISNSEEAKERAKELPTNVKFELGRHSDELLKCDLIIKSPGIPPTAPIIRKLVDNKKRIIDEIEFAYKHMKYEKLIAITGTNGKTTVTTLVGEILKSAGLKTIVCGNIGNPASAFIDVSDERTYVVMEVSSFQLMFIEDFKPDISSILNITSEHLDYHASFDEYVLAKSNIFKNQSPNEICVLNRQNEVVYNLRKSVSARTFLFSTEESEDANCWCSGDKIYIRNDYLISFPFTTNLIGKHNLENILCSALIAHLCGVNTKEISNVVSNFKGLEHRLEFVDEINGVKFINDSKSTNPDCVRVALQTFNEPIHLIMGGKDKMLDYSSLKALVSSKVKEIYLIGETAEKLKETFKDVVPVRLCFNLEQAVKDAFSNAKRNEIVLLSPGCSSFDQFKNFEERGRIFKELVSRLKC